MFDSFTHRQIHAEARYVHVWSIVVGSSSTSVTWNSSSVTVWQRPSG